MTTDIFRLTTSLAGRYTIERELGRGGMATVYLARDLKHERNVAVKVLHPDLAAALGAERFLAEIRTTANLQHPHILPLHDSGDADGLLFYVMPFVQGETLRARLEREQQLPIDDAVRITREVLSALDYACRHNVVHRDIKPENVLLHDGSALVADFGIALAVQSASGPRMTQTGLSLGTPSYMSPEQAMGEKTIDGRTDIYAAGAMLYEMLSGEPPFIGATVQAIVAKVITERPTPLSTVRDTVPPGVEAAVLKSLAKLPADRFATASQFADALSRGLAETTTNSVPTRARKQSSRRERLILGVLAGLVLALGTMATLMWRAASSAVPERIAFEISPDMVYPSSGGFALSPDGRRLAVLVQDTSAARRGVVAIRELGSTEMRTLSATVDATVVGWSADSRDLFFGNNTYISRIAVADGGVPRKVTLDSIRGVYGNMGPEANGLILFSDGGRLAVVPAAGGKVRHVYADSVKLPPQVLPRFLADGKHFIFATGYQGGVTGTWIGSVDGEPPRQITPLFSKVVTGDGHLFFVRDGALVTQAFDEGKAELQGEPQLVASGVSFDTFTGDAQFDVAGQTLVFGHGNNDRMKVLEWYERSGKRQGVVGSPMPSAEMALSPDERSVVFDLVNKGGFDVWSMNLQTGIRSRVTTDKVSNSPVWMPGSREIVYQRRVGPLAHLRRHVLGTTMDTAISPVPGTGLNVEDVSPDGATVIARSGPQLYTIPSAGGAPTPVFKRPNLAQARFSPDGHWVSFNDRETDAHEVYVASYPKFDRVLRVSSAGGMQARWRRDGRELLYLTPQGKVMSVAVSAQGDDPFGAPVELFTSPIWSPSYFSDIWSVTGDAKRFLFLALPDGVQNTRSPLTVIRNWTSSSAGVR